MGKIVDNYVLERIIGKGQFGEVYKGYNKLNNTDVAVKAINRTKLKGKYYELLENEIKVLRSCENPNIIRLYDIKKTNNNIYLMLEFCNEGDLMQYLKIKKKLVEEEAVEIFVQIINAFKVLVKNKIMHRDFKLANILKHNGVIKIADFGFAKILGDDVMATTMLGSPLNMGPEILAGKEYNSKADIWSIGTCFYELLFGKPPYTANSIVELLKKIHKNPFELPPGAKVSPQVEDVLKRMLKFNPDDRLEWEELFDHPILRMQEARIMQELEETAKNNTINNVSRFYINNNKVIENVCEIEKKTDINNYALALAKNNQPQTFTGNYVNRAAMRSEEDVVGIQQKTPANEVPSNEALPSTETEREREIRTFKHNSSRILHERNKYVFLASVAEEAINHAFKYSDLLVFALIKKLFRMICEIKNSLESLKNSFGLDMWGQYVLSKDFKKIGNYIFKEHELFKTYYENLADNLRKKVSGQDMKNPYIEKLLKSITEDEVNQILRKLLKDYIENVFFVNQGEYLKRRKDILIHFNQLIDCLNSDKVFFFESNARQFNFKLFYEEVKNLSVDEIYEIVKTKLRVENVKYP